MLDIQAVASDMGKNSNPETDVNDDGATNIQDLALVGLHYGEKYGQSGGLLAPPKQ